MSKDANLVWPYPPGTTVIYTSVRDDPRTARLTRTTTDAWAAGHGADLVGVEGVSGGVAITHLAVVSASQLDEAHARTMAWLDKFQGLAAQKEVELLKWRAWAREYVTRECIDDDVLRESVSFLVGDPWRFEP